jgi:hypothetical protein
MVGVNGGDRWVGALRDGGHDGSKEKGPRAPLVVG